MYSINPKGKWIDCDTCNRPHREILQSDLDSYIDKETLLPIVLPYNIMTQCYNCTPLKLYYKYECNNCGIISILETHYNESKKTICPHCLNDSNKVYSKSPSIVESLPKLDSGAKELFNRIKKRNIGSNMPDY